MAAKKGTGGQKASNLFSWTGTKGLGRGQSLKQVENRRDVMASYRQSVSMPPPPSASGNSSQSRDRSFTYTPSRPMPSVESDEEYKILFPYDARLSDELTTKPGDVVTVSNLYKHTQGSPWIKGTLSGESGYFYASFATSSFDKATTSAPLKRKPEGHEVSFFDHPIVAKETPGEDLECMICKNLAINPHQSKCCGHTICLGCGERWRKRSDSCPSCRAEPLSMVEDPRSKRYILSLGIFCPNYSDGCDWEGTVSGLKAHLNEVCKSALIFCPAAHCKVRVRRDELHKHQSRDCDQRHMTCPRCSLLGMQMQDTGLQEPLTFRFIVTEHYKVCPGWPMRCPYEATCGGSDLTRASLQAHLDEDCPEQVISCQFSEVGCGVRVRRREMAEHVNSATKNHLCILKDDHAKTKKDHAKTVRELSDEMSLLRQENSELKSQTLQFVDLVQSLKDEVEQLKCSTAISNDATS